MAALSILQVANYLIPLLVLPVISRVLGASLFGSVGYAQNIISYLTLLVNFGFEVQKSTYRCPWHNWKFEAEQLKTYNHIYLEESKK